MTQTEVHTYEAIIAVLVLGVGVALNELNKIQKGEEPFWKRWRK